VHQYSIKVWIKGMKTLRKLLLLAGVIGLWYALPSSMTPSLFGNNATSSEHRALRDFNAVSAGGRTNVFITVGDDYKIGVRASERGLKSLHTSVTDGTLRISQSGWWFRTPTVDIDVMLPALGHVEASGATTVTVVSPLNQESLRIHSSGASTVSLDATLELLDAQSSGASDINIRGFAQRANIRTSGSSDFRGNEFRSEQADVRLSGSSDVYITVTESITGNMSGSSDIHIRGNPTIDVGTSGSTSIRRLD
jgi:hypothetical protein